MDGFTASQRVLPCRWSIIRIGYLAFLAAGCGHTECWKISGAAAPDFFLACLALMLGCGSDSTVLLARLALCALSDNGGIATYYLVDLCDLILGITLVYLI